MDEDIFFADFNRGIFASRNGNLYITEPGSYELRDDPFVIPYPFRVVPDNSKDDNQFITIFTDSGYIYVLNLLTLKWEFKSLLPPDIGVIETMEILDNGSSVLLTSNQKSYIYANGWIEKSESVESLMVKDDQRVTAQITQLENEICAAKYSKDIDKFRAAIESYLICLANFSKEEVFIPIWYDIVKNQKYPFDSHELHEVWSECINLLKTVDRLQSKIDELIMSIGD